MRFAYAFFCLTTLLAFQHGDRDLRIDSASQRDFTKQLRVALVVGISAYPTSSGISTLSYASRDADVLSEVLKSKGYLVRLLKDSDATGPLIRRALRQLSDALSPDQGTLLFFFAGHGYSYKHGNYLATFELTADDLENGGLAIAQVESLIQQTKAKRKIMFIDACRNEPGQGDRSMNLRSFENLQSSEGIRELYSTGAGRVSYESGVLHQGIFTYFLAKGLAGEAAGSDGLVTFRDLTQYVTNHMRAYTVEKGQEVQIPFEAGESSGDFLLSVGSSAPVAASATEVRPGDAPNSNSRPPVGEGMTNATSPNDSTGNNPARPTVSALTKKVNPKDHLTYVWIPPGRFMMGCSPQDSKCDRDEKPAREANIPRGFWMGEMVTQEAYARVTGQYPSRFKGSQLPVETVSWDEARTYCESTGMRLPTEAEWEYAARSGTKSATYGDLDSIAWYAENSGGQTHDVKGKQPNAYGLYDMLGNVWQWTADWYETDRYRSLRGGAWDSLAWNVRVSSRARDAAHYRSNNLGIRCAGD